MWGFGRSEMFSIGALPAVDGVYIKKKTCWTYLLIESSCKVLWPFNGECEAHIQNYNTTLYITQQRIRDAEIQAGRDDGPKIYGFKWAPKSYQKQYAVDQKSQPTVVSRCGERVDSKIVFKIRRIQIIVGINADSRPSIEQGFCGIRVPKMLGSKPKLWL